MDDRYTDDDFYNYPFPSFTDNRNKFARASLILGMCSIVLICTLFLHSSGRTGTSLLFSVQKAS